MRYLYTIEDGKAKLITSIDEQSQQVHIQETYPAQEYRDGYTSFLAYNEEQGVHWEFKKRPAAELREQAYRTIKIIRYGEQFLTVDEANKMWLEYQAEGSAKAIEISTLISNAKSFIRTSYPDEVVEETPSEEDNGENEFIGADSEVGEEQFGDEILDDEEDPLLNVEIVGEDAEDDEIIDEIESMGNID